MENITRLIITVLFISLIAISIIFFGVLVVGPLTATNKIGKILQPTNTPSQSNSTQEQPPAVSINFENNGLSSNETNQNSYPSSPNSTPPQNQQNIISPPASAHQTTSSDFSSTPPSPPSPSPTHTTSTSPFSFPPLSPNDYELIEQSNIISPNDIPQNSLQITIKNGQIVPNVITANAGTITLYITSGDNFVHVFKFDNKDLGQIAIGVPPFSTRFLKFKLLKPGTYGFHDDVPSNQQITGKLIIQ